MRSLTSTPWSTILVAAAALAFGCQDKTLETLPPPAAASAMATASAARSPQEVKRAILDMIQDSQRRGLAGRDPKAFLRIWAADARTVSGRRRQPDGYDHVLERPALERAAKARSRGTADVTIEMSYLDEQVTLAGDKATVVWRLQSNWRTKHGNFGQELTAERYELAKTDKGWRVKENRFWPLSQKYGDKEIIYDDAKWEELDAAVDGAKAKADEIALAIALYEAWRVREGFELTGKLTKKIPGRGEYWLWRARFADRMRDIDETLRAYEQLKTIDPRAEMPGWVAAHQGGP